MITETQLVAQGYSVVDTIDTLKILEGDRDIVLLQPGSAFVLKSESPSVTAARQAIIMDLLMTLSSQLKGQVKADFRRKVNAVRSALPMDLLSSVKTRPSVKKVTKKKAAKKVAASKKKARKKRNG